jgi:hypothetical protein
MPTEVGGIELDWEANNQVEMFSCQFVYNWYEESAITNGGDDHPRSTPRSTSNLD